MADNPRLEVQIGADVQDINLALATLEKSLENLQKQAGETKGLDKLKKTFDQLGDEATVVRNELINAGKTTKELSSGFGDAAGRAQDLVGGLADVASGADGAVGSIGTLIGAFAAGGGLASVATAALDIIVQNWDKVLRAIGNVNQLLLDQAAIYSSLAGVNREQIDLIDDQIELARLQGATEEEIRNLQAQKAAAIGDALTTAKEQFRVQDQIAKRAEEELAIVEKVNKAFADAGPNATRESIVEGLGLSETEILNAVRKASDLVDLTTKANEERRKAIELERGAVGLQTELQAIGVDNLADLQKAATQREKEYNAELKRIDGIKNAELKRQKALELEEKRRLSELTKNARIEDRVFKIVAELETDEFENQFAEFDEFLKENNISIPVTFDPGTDPEEGTQDVPEIPVPTLFGEDLSALTGGAIADGITDAAAAIGQAIADGDNVIAAVGQSLIQTLSGFIGNLGSLLIEYGSLAVAKGVLDQAIAAGGVTSIAAGIAAIAVGSALVAAGSAIGTFAQTGGSSGGAAGVGSSGGSFNPASARTPSFSGGQQTYVFEIAGTKLIGVINNTLARNNRSDSQFLI